MGDKTQHLYVVSLTNLQLFLKVCRAKFESFAIFDVFSGSLFDVGALKIKFFIAYSNNNNMSILKT
jgi:hypothetical protein